MTILNTTLLPHSESATVTGTRLTAQDKPLTWERYVDCGDIQRIWFFYALPLESATTNGQSIVKTHNTRMPPPLSREERKRRQGIPPLDRLVAIHDEVPYNISPSKAGKLLGAVPVSRQLG